MASRSANILSGIETFVTLVNTGSFTNAAQSIGKSASFVSKEISRLEDRLGIRLLNRTTRSLTLTDMGALYFEQCRHIIAGAVAAEQSI
ncbi:MAG: LysR family transcriptional regulator, partial [Methyloligellaceae bacterium]